jgi:peptide/nickel transport system substrate-binding protein
MKMSGSSVRRMIALTLVVTSLLVGVSCSSSGNSSGTGTTLDESQPVSGGKIVFGLTAETNGWNPTKDQWTVDGHLVASSFYESLTAVGPDDDIVPELAESLDHNDDFTQWTIHLRDGVMFHDGTPCDAAAVKANLDASRNGIGALALKIIDSIDASDPSKVVVNLNSPWSAFPGALTGAPGYMASPQSLADDTASSHPVGTGPFVFSQWTPDRSLKVTKNPNYWQKGLPYLDELEYQTMIDNTTRGAALESGSVDMMLTVSADDAVKYRSLSGYNTITDDTAEENHVSLNFAKPPFDNALARQAIIHATDQDAIVQAIGPGVITPADGPFGPGEPWYTPDSHYAGYDPDAAASEVTEYEQQTGESLRFTLMTFPDDTSVRQAQLLQEMWTKAGAQVRLESLEQSAFISRIVVGDFDAAMSSNFGYGDPDFNWIFWHSALMAPLGQISLNFLHNANPQTDAALDAARRTDDVQARATQYQKVTQLLNDDFSYVWLYRTPYTIVAHDYVGGMSAVGDAGFARADAKPWVARLWVEPQAQR